jgi:hypothetical protein
MRNDFTPQVETREIADSDLDNISGGILGLVGDVVGTAESVLPVSLPLAQVTGLVGQATGLVAGL